MKRDLSFLNKEIIDRIKKWVVESSKWNCPFVYNVIYMDPQSRLRRHCDYCEKIFPGIKDRFKPKTTLGNCPCGHYEYRYVKRIANLIITKEHSLRN